LLFSLEITVGILLAVALAILGLVFLRRRAIARKGLLTMCGVRRQRGTWRLGLLRYGRGQLEWFALDGVSVRPKYCWIQQRMELGVPVQAAAGQGLDGLGDAIAVGCRHEGDTFELAMTEGAYMALRSWLEAAPPGAASAVT
jgi:hypothetical protein